MTGPLLHPTDAAILALLEDEPLPARAVAAQLDLPERTARHRLRQLRACGLITKDLMGLHHPSGLELDFEPRHKPTPAIPSEGEGNEGLAALVLLTTFLGIAVANWRRLRNG
jgi:hypothetical protein